MLPQRRAARSVVPYRCSDERIEAMQPDLSVCPFEIAAMTSPPLRGVDTAGWLDVIGSTGPGCAAGCR
jgi:hypothetical protein